MKFSKKHIAGVIFLLASAANAETLLQNIQVRAVVPSGSFYVNALEGWPSGPVQIGYDSNRHVFNHHHLGLRMKNSIQSGAAGGKIMARLAYPPVMRGVRGQMSVDVGIKTENTDVILGTTPTLIYEDAAGDEIMGHLHIKVKDAGPYAPGNYIGTVALEFDSVL